MSMGRLLALVFGGIALVMAAIWVNGFLARANVYTELDYHSDLACEPVLGAPGSEDLQIDHATGYAFLSSSDRRALFAALAAGGPTTDGAIYGYDLRTGELRAITPDAPEGFQPHGVSLYRDGDLLKLFAISHPALGVHTFEIFDVTFETPDGFPLLRHWETITLSPDVMISPNDLVAVGPRQFYFSNDHGSETDLGRMMEDYLQLPRASVGYFDGQGGRLVATGLTYANGINVSGDGEMIYVAQVSGDGVRFYDRDIASGDLTLAGNIFLHTGLDNIDIAADGSLWIGSHPKPLKLVAHFSDPEAHSPSQVLKLTIDPSGVGGAADEVHLSDGTDIDGSSVAAEWNGDVLIGAIMEDQFLHCQMQ